MSKLKGLAWLGVAATAGMAVAVGLPWLARHIPWSFERRLAGIDATFEATTCGKPPDAAHRALQRLVSRLYPLDADDRAIPISIDVVRGDTVNAFAALGGRIYVYDGLLQQAQSPDELAGVLAHEIEHVRQRHIMQGVVVSLVTWGGLKLIFQTGDAGMTRLLLSLSFSREQEAEADEGGLQRLRRARISARGFQQFFERAGNEAGVPSILASHPAGEDRAARAARFAGYPASPAMDAGDWRELRTICAH